MDSYNRYLPELAEIPPAMSDLLEDYSNIPRADQINHILKVRDSAWTAHQYPCLGRFRFLQLDLSQHPLYTQQVLPKLKDDSTNPAPLFLDLGTCLGQDVRKLIFDGVPVSRIYAGDIVEDFINAGYELFCDQAKLPRGHIIYPADVFDNSPSNPLSKLDNQVTVLHATAVFHLFDLPKMKLMADRCLRLLRKDAGKVLILGSQIARIEAGEREGSNKSRWVHNSESWEGMWKDVCSQEPWKDVVKAVEVNSSLTIPPMYEGTARAAEMAASGGRWMQYEVWVTFNN